MVEVDRIFGQIENFKDSDRALPNALVDPTHFLVEYGHTVSRVARFPVKAQAMYIEGDRIGELFEGSLESGLRRGTSVAQNIDAYAVMFTNGQKNTLIKKEGPKNLNYQVLLNKERLYSQFVKNGGVLTITNLPQWIGKLVHQAGRNHQKLYLGDYNLERFVFAGKVNIGEGDFDNRPDFLVKFTDEAVVTAFDDLFTLSRQVQIRHDRSIQCNEHTTIHTDAGRPFRSLIQTRTLSLARDSQETVEGVQPFIPDFAYLGTLNYILKNGRYLDLVVSDPDKIWDTALAKAAHINKNIFDRLSDNSYLSIYPGWIHAAMMLFDRKRVLFTTHNFSIWGVILGTTEWAIETTQPDIIRQCIDFFENTKALSGSYSEYTNARIFGVRHIPKRSSAS